MKFDDETRAQLLAISPATVDRLLKRAREGTKPHGLSATKPGTLLKHTIPIRTFAQWDDAQPGFMEIDLVAHYPWRVPQQPRHGGWLHPLGRIGGADQPQPPLESKILS